MLQVSTEPIPGGQKFVNSGFANRCVICGGYFDECGTCNNGHEQGHVYYYLPEGQLKPEKLVVPQKKEETMVLCRAFNGCRCTICGGFFGDGDDICASGHEIGQQYHKLAS